MRLKYGNIRTYSNLCQRDFASRMECQRGEELHLWQLGGYISNLEYQPKFVLSEKPKITYTADFRYKEHNGKVVVEDCKGILTRETRVKLVWLKEKLGVDVLLTNKNST